MQPPDIRGSWTSVALENMDSHWATRTFDIDYRTWSVIYRAWADAEGRTPLFTLKVGGVYLLGRPSAIIAGAFEGVFPQQERSVRVESEAGVHMFAAAGAEVRSGDERDLVAERIGFIPCVMDAMGEYDLVAIRDGCLFFGDRGGDLSKARPECLSEFPLQRVN